MILQSLGDLPAARPQFEECLAISRALGNTRLAAYTLGNMGKMTRPQGDLVQHMLQIPSLTSQKSSI